MEHRALGGSGLHVSRVGLGTMAWGRDVEWPVVRELVHDFVEAGGNLIDTAPPHERRRAPHPAVAPPSQPDRPPKVKSFGVVFFRSGGDGGQGGATVDAVGAVVGLEHVGQAAQ